MFSKLKFLIPPRFRKKEEKKVEEDLFFVRTSDRRRTIEELIQESKLSQSYYFMLIFSAIIVTVGLLVSNMAIIIAGMLVAPLLKPVLAFALGIVTHDLRLFFRSFAIIVISSVFVVVISVSIYFIYEPYIETFQENQFTFNSLYFLLAVFSGMAAAFSWTKPGAMQDTLTGTAIAVTMLPPLGMLGIYMAQFDIEMTRATLFVYTYNLMTVVTGGALVFVLSGFATQRVLKDEIEKQLDKEEKE